ncbi:hypothetical protein [Saccharopolyspora shandongensis]|uniref:hypothetical protein n=1 Tax=Saccharopolyspora shandongensis TaxID=418495 RepID=UPI0033BFF2BE
MPTRYRRRIERGPSLATREMLRAITRGAIIDHRTSHGDIRPCWINPQAAHGWHRIGEHARDILNPADGPLWIGPEDAAVLRALIEHGQVRHTRSGYRVAGGGAG